MKKFMLAAAGMLLFGFIPMAAISQNVSEKPIQNIPTHVAAKIQSQLELRYPLATTTADGADIVAAGAVLVLQKDNLVMNKVYMSETHRSSPVENVYENSKINQVGLLGVLSSINSVLSVFGGIEAQSRSFGHGQKLWVTKITVQADGIVFRLMSDPMNNMRYHGTLKFPYENVFAADQVAVLVADVLTTDPPTDASGVAIAQGTSVAVTSPTPPIVDEGEEIRRAAEAGDANAMFRLGNMLAQRGENIDAVRWFRQASDKGHIKATNALGFMYEEGRGVPQNYGQASNLYLKAMKGGNSDAMVNRAIMLAQGKGVNKDPLQAYMHLLLAAAYATDQETRDAAVKLKNEVAAKLSKQQITRGQVLADKFAKEEIK